MMRSRYGSSERKFATVLGASASSNRALKVNGPATISIRLMQVLPSNRKRAGVEAERQVARRPDHVVRRPRQELAAAGLGLHLAVPHQYRAAADGGDGPAGDLQPLIRRIVDDV